MLDYFTQKKLLDLGYAADSDVWLTCEAIMNEPRVLDAAPPRLKLTSAKDAMRCGICDLYVSAYNTVIASIPDDLDIFYFELLGTRIILDKRVYVTLKTLLSHCVYSDQNVAAAAADIVKTIIGAYRDKPVITDGMLYIVLSQINKLNTVYKELVQGILLTAFPDNELVMHWRQITDCGNFYTKARKAGEEYAVQFDSVKELDTTLNKAAVQAKKDKNFMNSLLKGVPPKPLIGFIYLHRETNPEYLEPEEYSDFAQ